MVPRPPLAALLGVLAACAADTSGAPEVASGTAGRCEALFREYDRAARRTPQPGNADRIASPEVMRWASRLRASNCVTLTRAIDLGAPVDLPPDPGVAIDPVSLHAGIVTSDADDAMVRAFFQGRGVPARSVGAPLLGRRIYLGPFDTSGDLDRAEALARAVGFAAPYPARF